MAVYTVHQPPQLPADPIEQAERLEFVKDGFSWAAALMPPISLAANAAWDCLAVYMAACVALGGLSSALAFSAGWIGLMTLALNIAFGFEAANCRRRSLERQGWSEIGVVTGRDLMECERRFFDSWQPVAGSPVTPNDAGPAGLQKKLSNYTAATSALWRRLSGAET